MTKTSSASRLADFSDRAAKAPDQVLVHSTRGWRYIGIHPFADDVELLRDLGVQPESCISVDAYWEFDGDVYLLQVVSADWGWSRTKGYYYRWRGSRRGWNLVAILGSGPIFVLHSRTS